MVEISCRLEVLLLMDHSGVRLVHDEVDLQLVGFVADRQQLDLSAATVVVVDSSQVDVGHGDDLINLRN